ncbi:gas vesicle protein GvpO [Sphaerimonospora sp. CA-214678]|uniref:gas vesicle protein GvpO n=1 Tax=Sphaerimonospora sp. CA-214678 TaxID=3240029 RepID=UPI003D8BFF31
MPPSRRSRYEYRAGPYGRTAVSEAGEGDERVEQSRARQRALNAATAGRAGARYIADLTAKVPEGVTLVEPLENGWVVGVEVVEDHRIPSSGDILAVYEAEMDDEGNLLAYRRVRRYRRGTGDCVEGLPR